ncbi:MAG TPA: BsuPI-related putative proteinase inhibitor [Candidatus Baltobacteraceae bacterium]|nr:BsuPI-related putative proteinase inhibitor [Candidatus Baltobacteraceae bacterium]
MLALAALTLSLQLQQTSYDLLDGVSIEVAVHNSANAPVAVAFAQPAEYRISVLRGDRVIWSSSTAEPAGVTFPIHKHTFVQGPSVLVVYVWNTIESDGSTPDPGDYTVRAQLLGQNLAPQATAMLHFIPPVPLAAVEKLKLGNSVTVSGTLDPTKQILTDSSGSLVLARRLITAPDEPVAVRGYLIRRPDRTLVFFVQRWAPLQ